jgi:hypothetical protein
VDSQTVLMIDYPINFILIGDLLYIYIHIYIYIYSAALGTVAIGHKDAATPKYLPSET